MSDNRTASQGKKRLECSGEANWAHRRYLKRDHNGMTLDQCGGGQPLSNGQTPCGQGARPRDENRELYFCRFFLRNSLVKWPSGGRQKRPSVTRAVWTQFLFMHDDSEGESCSLQDQRRTQCALVGAGYHPVPGHFRHFSQIWPKMGNAYSGALQQAAAPTQLLLLKWKASGMDCGTYLQICARARHATCAIHFLWCFLKEIATIVGEKSDKCRRHSESLSICLRQSSIFVGLWAEHFCHLAVCQRVPWYFVRRHWGFWCPLGAWHHYYLSLAALRTLGGLPLMPVLLHLSFLWVFPFTVT